MEGRAEGQFPAVGKVNVSPPLHVLRMTQSPLSGVKHAQRLWAQNAGHQIDDQGYLPDVAQNLFGGLSAEVRAEFEQADGAELVDRDDRPAKMRSVVSSSALAVNVFQHWKLNDPAPVGRALRLPSPATSIAFEQRLRTGAGGTPPNLDVVITTSDGGIVGIESKFTEWMTRKTGQAASMAPYFRKPETLWKRGGLTECERLARDISDGKKTYVNLDAPQLLKHILGLQKQAARPWALLYLWYDAEGETGDAHRKELADFGTRVGAELAFQAVSYQSLAQALAVEAQASPEYLTYLNVRYALGTN